MNTQPRCHYIPPQTAFLPALASWVLETHGQTPEKLSNLLILLQNRRSCRSLREAFLAQTGGTPLLLPRMQSLSDLDEQALWLSAIELPPAPAPIPALRRELLLTRLVAAYRRATAATPEGQVFNLEQSAQLARQLGQFLDECTREGRDFSTLKDLVTDENLAIHWQETTRFLKIITEEWPKLLSAMDCTDDAAHRTRLLRAAADVWRAQPPSYPVIAAGITSTLPAVSGLLHVIARLPQGRVVLPGVDVHMPEGQWNNLPETHPQYGILRLLSALECPREALNSLLAEAEPPPRTQLLDAAFAPPSATAQWPSASVPLEQGLSGMRLVVAETQHEEARIIAALLRETLETPQKTAAFVTPDRQLARMVAAQLERYGVPIDDSGGTPLSHIPAACFLRLINDCCASHAAPAALLALLRHPLAALGMKPADCRRLSRVIEVSLLRGLRLAPGFEPLTAAARAELAREPAAIQLLERLHEILVPYMRGFAGAPLPLAEWLRTHIQVVEQLATTHEIPGAQRLWHGDAGAQLAAYLAELIEHADALPQVGWSEYPALLEFWLGGQVFRPRFGSHPRLHIFGPMEARQQQFDRLILGSLTEGSWPQGSPTDPWMSRPMRKQFGLPPPEADIGQSAHDAYLFCHAPEVIMTYAKKVEGSPTIASRWLVRLQTLVEGLNKPLWQSFTNASDIHALLAAASAPAALPPLPRPSFSPPVSARPKRVSVTRVDEWLADPYAFYARYVLSLYKLDELDKQPSAAEFGTMVHAAIEAFTRANPTGFPPDTEEQLLACGRTAFEAMAARPAVAAIWWPRYAAIVPWLAAQEQLRRQPGVTCYAEVKGEWKLPDYPMTLNGRIDRLELDSARHASITDYKTGEVPKPSEAKNGTKNQLQLLALLAQYGQLDSAPNAEATTTLSYWKLGATAEKCSVSDKFSPDLIEPARELLYNLLNTYITEEKPYTASAITRRYNDYEHLTRRQEWQEV